MFDALKKKIHMAHLQMISPAVSYHRLSPPQSNALLTHLFAFLSLTPPLPDEYVR